MELGVVITLADHPFVVEVSSSSEDRGDTAAGGDDEDDGNIMDGGKSSLSVDEEFVDRGEGRDTLP